MSQIDYLSELNEEQYAAVTAPDGYILVLAGAGSGKTRVITYRVAWLIEKGINFDSIMLLTFTNKAAFSMLSRVEYILNVPAFQITGGTFHSVANRFLRRYSEVIGYENNFTILDETDSLSLMRRARSNIIKYDKANFPSPKVLLNIYSSSVNHNQSLENIVARYHYEHLDKFDTIEKIIMEYSILKRKANSMDYDDLLTNFYTLLLEYPDINHKISEQFKHILVDEFQDTNHFQAQICKLLSNVNNNLFVVGDDAQSIYGFRGADFTNIINFPNYFPNVKIYKLQTNYRSCPYILYFANNIMDNASKKFKKTLKPIREDNKKPALIYVYDSREQAQIVAGIIEDKLNEGYKPNDLAVLFRTHRNSQEIEFELTRNGIKYAIRGGLRFVERAHIKDACAYINILFNPNDLTSWERVFNHCDNVGEASIDKIINKLQNIDEHPITLFLKMDFSDLPSKAKTSLNNLKNFLILLLKHINDSPQSIIKRIIDYIKPYIESQYDNIQQRREDLAQLHSYASKFDALQNLAQDLALQSGYSRLDEHIINSEEKVVLTTIHQAKGLEWRVVFLISAVDGVIPHSMCFYNQNQLEEERRLLYVAVTRAKDELFIICPQYFNDSFRGAIKYYQPSRFIREVDKANYEKFKVSIE